MENQNAALEWATTNQLNIDKRIINLIIEDLKEIEVTPETMIFILKQLDLQEQVFKQLMNERPF